MDIVLFLSRRLQVATAALVVLGAAQLALAAPPRTSPTEVRGLLSHPLMPAEAGTQVLAPRSPR